MYTLLLNVFIIDKILLNTSLISCKKNIKSTSEDRNHCCIVGIYRRQDMT